MERDNNRAWLDALPFVFWKKRSEEEPEWEIVRELTPADLIHIYDSDATRLVNHARLLRGNPTRGLFGADMSIDYKKEKGRVVVRVSSKRARKAIVDPAGHTAYGWVKLLYSKKTYERVFEPSLVDLREEHFEALAAGQPRLASWIAFRGHLILALAVVAHFGAWFAKLFSTSWKSFSP